MNSIPILENKFILTAEDRHQFDTYQFQLQDSKSIGIIVLHEIFGMTDFIKNMCRLWAKKGYQVVAPALYDRFEKNVAIPYSEEGYKKALDYKQQVLNWDKQLLDIEASKLYLQENGATEIGVIGYSWGGTLSWLAACRLPDIIYAISYYGTHIFQFKDEIPNCPCLLHFANFDDLVPTDHVNEIKDLHPSIQIQLYNATHGFRCENWQGGHGQEFDAKASVLADKLTVNFLLKFAPQLKAYVKL